MSLVKLDVYAVRNILEQSIALSPKLNFFYGENASGKSALIEAIYLLGRAKSFRSATIKPVINYQKDALVISGKILQTSGHYLQLGLRLDGRTTEIHLNHQLTNQKSDLAYALPLQLIHPKSFELLDSGPQLRREFLDWGGFHAHNDYLTNWRRFKKALLQRNVLIKSGHIDHIDVWNNELGYYGTIIHESRRRYLEKLLPFFIQILAKFEAINNNIELSIVAGWDFTKPLKQVLQEDLEKDLRLGFTTNGPHRGDFQLMINNRLAKDYVSRGQLKLLVVCLRLAQIDLLLHEADLPGCILIDDFAAELDQFNRAILLEHLISCRSQVVLTATNKEDFGDLNFIDNFKMFHVEQGRINSL